MEPNQKVLILVLIVRVFNCNSCSTVVSTLSKQAPRSAGVNEEVYIKQNVVPDYSRANSKYLIDNYESPDKEHPPITIKTDFYFNYRGTKKSNTNGEKHIVVSPMRRPAPNNVKHGPFMKRILQRTKRFNIPLKPENFHESINRSIAQVSRVNRNRLEGTTEQNSIDSTPSSGDGTEFYYTDKANDIYMFTNNNKRSSVQQLPTTISFGRQQPTNLTSNETLATRIRSGGELKFLDVPPGGGMRTPDLELDDGYAIFNFISSSIAYLQTSDFPAGLLRDWLWNGLTVIEPIIQIIRVEGGIVGCLVVFILLGLILPSAILAHVSCRLTLTNSDSTRTGSELSDTQLRCRKLILVILLELMLILLPLGIVGMFLSNEHLSRSVNRSPEVAQVVLEDLSTFVRNTHLQVRFVATTAVDQAVDAAIGDLEDVEDLLGRPIQGELATETGVDVALDALSDICSASADIAAEVTTLRAEAQAARDMARTSQERLKELRKQVETTRTQCTSVDKALCDTIDTSGLEITFKVDKMLAERKLSRLRHLGDDNLTSATDGARLEYQDIPQRVVRDTLHTRQEIKNTLIRQREVLYSSIEALEDVSRDFTTSIRVANGHVTRVVRAMTDIEQWRWLTGLGASISVLLIWCLLTSGVVCVHCGCVTRVIPSFLIAIGLICLLSVFLWALASVALVIGGNGELFICRPLYDNPNYVTLTLLLDNPGMIYKQGGLFSNILKGNESMDVPVKSILRECRLNQPSFPTLNLNRIFNIDSVTNHLTWPKFHGHLAKLTVNINDIEILKAGLQKYLQDISQASRVNLTLHRTQLSGSVMATDLNSFADQLERIANQMTDLTTSARMETLASRCRKLLSNNLQRLEKHRDEIVYKLTALEVHLQPLQRQANQSLSHLKTIQYYLTNQGSTISEGKTNEYVARLVKYLERFREHVLNQLTYEVAPCRPLWDIYQTTRVQLCKHLVEPTNGFWVSTVWCLVTFIIITPVTMVLIHYYKHIYINGQFRRDLGEFLLAEQGPWTTSSSHSTPESLATPEQSSWTTPRRPSEQLLIPPSGPTPEPMQIPPRRLAATRVSPRQRHESLRMIESTSWRDPSLPAPRGWL